MVVSLFVMFEAVDLYLNPFINLGLPNGVLLIVIPFSFIQLLIKRETFFHQPFGCPELHVIVERQNKCFILCFYLLIFRIMSWFPNIFQRWPMMEFVYLVSLYVHKFKLIWCKQCSKWCSNWLSGLCFKVIKLNKISLKFIKMLLKNVLKDKWNSIFTQMNLHI